MVAGDRHFILDHIKLKTSNLEVAITYTIQIDGTCEVLVETVIPVYHLS